MISGEPQTVRRAFVLAPGSRLSLEGNSTLHRWSAEATRLVARVDLAAAPGAGLREIALAPGVAREIELRVPFSGLKSGEGQLDEKLMAAVKADRFPEAVLRSTGYDGRAEEHALSLVLQGSLSVAGVEKAVEVAARVVLSSGGARVTGEHSLKMTDFGVKPPVLLFGALRAADAVVVRWDLKLVEEPPEC